MKTKTKLLRFNENEKSSLEISKTIFFIRNFFKIYTCTSTITIIKKDLKTKKN